MAATASILPIGNEKFKKSLSLPMSSCASLRVVPPGESKDQVASRFERYRNSPGATASKHVISVSLSGGVPVFSGMMGDPKSKDLVASLNEFVRSRSAAADAPEVIIAAALKECGSGRKYTGPATYASSNSFFEDYVGMGTANYPPMVINDDNGKACKVVDWDRELGKVYKARTMNGKASPSAPPCEGYPVLTTGIGKGVEVSPSELAYGEYGSSYSATPPRLWYDDFRKATPAASASSYAEYPSVLDEDHDNVIGNNRYCCIGGNGGGGSSGAASTASSFKNAIVKDRDEASSTGSGNTAPKKMKKKDNNFDTGVDCMAGFGGCVPFKFKAWVKRSKDKVYD